MNIKPSKSLGKIPTITNTGIKVAPFGGSSVYMELHKLAYKRDLLEEKVRKHNDEVQTIERTLQAIQKEMQLLLEREMRERAMNGDSPEKTRQKTQRLTY